MESGDETRSLSVTGGDNELAIDTDDEALQRANDAIAGDTNHSELEYLTAVRDVIRYVQAPGFGAETATDKHPPDPDEIDENALTEEVEGFEEELDISDE